jgi:hypothetical protein
LVDTYFLGSESSYSTLIGGSSEEEHTRIAFDNEGNTVIVGRTCSLDFPVTIDAFQTEFGGGIWDAFVAKFGVSGNLLYSSFIGGDSFDVPTRVIVDSENNIVIVGSTESLDFPITTDAMQSTLGGYRDGFIVKIAPNGTMIFSTYLGGTGEEIINGIEFDGEGNYLLGGHSASTGLGTPGVYQENSQGSVDAFVARISANGSALEMFSYIGGSNIDRCYSMTVDSSFNYIITGISESSDYPTTDGAFQTNHTGSFSDATLTKIAHNGTTLLFSTFVGGSDTEFGVGVDIDADDNIILAGYTASDDLVVKDAIQPDHAGGFDIFIAKFSSTGNLSFLTYYGTNTTDLASDLEIESEGNIIFVGITYSSDASGDVSVTKLSSDGQTVMTSSIIGGRLPDSGDDIAIDSEDDIVISGYTDSTDFPVSAGAYQSELAGSSDAFVYHVTVGTPTTTTSTTPTPGGTNLPLDTTTLLLIGAGAIALVIIAILMKRK